MDLKRRDLFGGATMAAAWAAAGGGLGGAALAEPAAKTSVDLAERNKQILRERRAAEQMRSLPSAMPDAPPFTGRMQGMAPPAGAPTQRISMVHNDSPVGRDMTAAERALIQGGFAQLALGPTFISYGPMLAEGDWVVEEWESQIYGSNNTLYNNQYLSLVKLENGQTVVFNEYNDTQHAAIIYGGPGKWPELKPPTNPRRRIRRGAPPTNLPANEVETVFEVTDKFNLNPRLLVDVIPSAGPAPVQVKPGAEGNKALVRGLHRAMAAGDLAAVNSFHGKGFRHWIAGEEGPFGWNHLPRQELYAPLVKHMTTPLTLYFGPMVADDTRVFQQMDSFARLDDGTVYNNWHAMIHEIRNGKIVQTREYHDPRHMWVVLGRFAPWGAKPIEPRSRPRRSNLQGIAATVQYPTTFGPDLERWLPFPPAAA